MGFSVERYYCLIKHWLVGVCELGLFKNYFYSFSIIRIGSKIVNINVTKVGILP